MQLREYCQLVQLDGAHFSDDQLLHASICLYYVSGIVDGYGVSGAKPQLICLPKDGSVTNGQMALIVSKFLNDHPDKLNNEPVYLVLEALSEAFRCLSQPKQK
jgi:hypothetical protein